MILTLRLAEYHMHIHYPLCVKQVQNVHLLQAPNPSVTPEHTAEHPQAHTHKAKVPELKLF